jgi:iron complex transport system substrate-binding protein
LVRIISLLPSATEIVYLLGLEASLVGVTHECDWPPGAESKPRVTRSRIPEGATEAEIDALVNAAAAGGQPTQWLDKEAVAALRPDLILTQDLCAVCAVPKGHLDAALDLLGLQAEVMSLDPSSIDDVLANIESVGNATGTEALAEEIVSCYRARLDDVERAVEGKPRPRTLALEWGDPPYNAGHWVPEMISRAGGEPVLGVPGAYSHQLTWEEIAEQEPEIVVFMPCGYHLDDVCAHAGPLMGRPELASAERFIAADSGGYFSRPGPRLVEGVEALAASFHGPGALPGVTARLR